MIYQDATHRVCTEQERIAWFKEAKFGLFIHWGLYSQLAGHWKGQPIRGIGEQIMRFAEIPVDEYEEIAKTFNPVHFDAMEWVKYAKDAGMKYVIITAKHHDGFAMYDSKVSDFNIVKATPYQKDPMKELAKACAHYGLKLCFYYSQYQDWTDPNGAFFWKQWGGTYPDSGKNFETYMNEKALPQIVELLTNYGPVGILWYDTAGNTSPYNSRRFKDIVHAVQPECLVGPRVGNNEGDYVGYGDNQVPNDSNNLPWESPATMNNTWGYKEQDQDWKSVGTLLRLLVSVVSKGGNYLLNVGPTGDGRIPEPSIQRLKEVGQWMKRNGKAIEDAVGCPLDYTPEWGAMTAGNGQVYLNLFEWPKDRHFALRGLKSPVLEARILSSGQSISFTQELKDGQESLTLSLPMEAPEETISVIALSIDGPVSIHQDLYEHNQRIKLPAHKAKITSDEDAMPILRGNPALRVDKSGVMEHWYRLIDHASWQFVVDMPGTYALHINTYTENQTSACEDMPWEGGHILEILCDGQTIEMTINADEATFPPTLFHRQNIRSNAGDAFHFKNAGTYTLTLKPRKLNTEQGLGLRLESVVLSKMKDN